MSQVLASHSGATALKAAQQHVGVVEAGQTQSGRAGAAAGRAVDVELIGWNATAGLIAVFHDERSCRTCVHVEVSQGGVARTAQAQHHAIIRSRPIEAGASLPRAVAHQLQVAARGDPQRGCDRVAPHRQVNDAALARQSRRFINGLLDHTGVRTGGNLEHSLCAVRRRGREGIVLRQAKPASEGLAVEAERQRLVPMGVALLTDDRGIVWAETSPAP